MILLVRCIMEGYCRWSVRLPETFLSAANLHDMGGYSHHAGLIFVLLSVCALVVILLPLCSYRNRVTRSLGPHIKCLSLEEKAYHHAEHLWSACLSHE